MRICLVIPSYSIVSFLSICFPNACVYLNPWLNVIQGIALATFFLLLCDYISTESHQRDAFFANVELWNKKTQEPIDGPALYQVIIYLSFYYFMRWMRGSLPILENLDVCHSITTPLSALSQHSLLLLPKLPKSTVWVAISHTLLIYG